jgi:hypothetical protein
MSYTSVKISTRCLKEYELLAEFCRTHALPYQVESFLDSSKLDDNYRKPTRAIKEFCGSEYQAPSGLIQPKAVVELIIRTARRLGLDKADGVIELNSLLQGVLNTTESSVLVSTLPARIDALFITGNVYTPEQHEEGF